MAMDSEDDMVEARPLDTGHELFADGKRVRLSEGDGSVIGGDNYSVTFTAGKDAMREGKLQGAGAVYSDAVKRMSNVSFTSYTSKSDSPRSRKKCGFKFKSLHDAYIIDSFVGS
jgi:hypothetical protein